MNKPFEFRYNHSSSDHVPIDSRSKPAEELKLEHCYFLGFRIPSGESSRYYHTWIMADDYDSLLYGISRECDEILALSPEVAPFNIDLVFLHSMRTRDPNFLSASVRKEISSDIGQCLNRRNDEHFAMFGLVGETSVRIAEWIAKDALMAIRVARLNSARLFEKSFMPLGVCQAHPVTTEFDQLFNMESERIEALIKSLPPESLH